MKSCTFKPAQISQAPRPDILEQQILELVKGASESVIRMNKGREQKFEKDSFWDKKYESYVNRSVNKTTMTIPFNFDRQERSMMSMRNSRLVLGNVDVNFQKGKKGKIVIYEGDDPAVLSANFCKIYSLNRDMQETLTEMLKNYMDKLAKESNNSSKEIPEESPNPKVDPHVDTQVEACVDAHVEAHVDAQADHRTDSQVEEGQGQQAEAQNL